jgi:RHH-type proline utilization regulon transcriptional repressor/proline dehydrogenase/delta 1-pyrroline-5-carboxylate dehydrogenase
MEQPLKILADIKGQILSEEKRQLLSVELADLLLQEAALQKTPEEKKDQEQLGHLLLDQTGKAFVTETTDQCFRSSSLRRSANQLVFILKKYGIPKFIPWTKALGCFVFRVLFLGGLEIFFRLFSCRLLKRLFEKKQNKSSF